MMNDYALEIKNVTKNFGSTIALKDVSLKFEENKIYGLLGRNGAGKTTLINVITNKIFADGGNALIFGDGACENDSAQAKIFCMAEQGAYPYDIKVKSVFKWLKRFYPSMDIEYAFRLAEKFNLDTNKVMKNLSTGYDTICRLIPVLASDSPIAIFDEPVLGLDAHHRELFYKELIQNFGAKPRTIIVSTHLIDEVADVLEDIIIIRQGEIILSQSVEELLSSAYVVSGISGNVDKYISGKKMIYSQTIGSLKTATIMGKKDDNDKLAIKELNLELSTSRLQELFIHITNS